MGKKGYCLARQHCRFEAYCFSQAAVGFSLMGVPPMPPKTKEMAFCSRYNCCEPIIGRQNAMKKFIENYSEMLTGNISVFDRIIFKGYLRNLCYPLGAEHFLSSQGVLFKDFRDFTHTHTEQLKKHAQELAQKANRPYEYHRDKKRKEDYARKIAKRDGVTEGLICVIARNEENHSFGLRYGKGRPNLVKNSPQCLTFYFYFMDRHFGLMHVRLCAWMPFSIQVYINGHEWLSRQMDRKGIDYEMLENAFAYIGDCKNAQNLADKLPVLKWEKILHVFARKVNPLLKTILSDLEYYWVIDQAEYATDVMVGNATWLDELYKKWQKHSAVCFQAEDIMGFMGRKLHGSFNSTIVTNVKKRPSVTRIKHVVRGNWIKMYNKNGIVLRVETVINRPAEFRVFRLCRGKKAGRFEPMRKRITNMHHYQRIGLRTNQAYLDSLSQVVDPVRAYRELRRVCEPALNKGRRARALNPLQDRERILFEAVMSGANHLHGFKANEIAAAIGMVESADPVEKKRLSARMNRKLRLLRDHGLITRHGRSRRYRITPLGARQMNTVIALYHETLPDTLGIAA
jgi:hypothetical protein